MNQMYRSFAAGTSFTTTNPNLQPMNNFGEEAGFDFNWKTVSLSATYFNNNLDNFIDFVAVCNANAACAAPFATAAGLTGITTVNQYNNVGSARFAGFEVLGGWQALPELKLSAGFTQTSAYLTSTTVPNLLRTGVQLGQVPTWMFNAAAEWRPIADLAIIVNLKSFPAYWNNTGHTQLNDGATLIDLGRELFLQQVDRHLRHDPEPDERAVLGAGLHDDHIRRADRQRHRHSGPRDAADRRRRSASPLLRSIMEKSPCVSRSRPRRS